MKHNVQRLTQAFGLILVLAILPIASIAGKGKNRIYDTNAIIAVIDNQAFTIQDVEDKQINDLRTNLYTLLKKKILLKTLEKLSEKHPEFAIPPHLDISEKAISDFYNNNHLQSRGTLELLKPQIKALLVNQAAYEYYQALFEKAKSEGLVVSYLTEPDEFQIQVPIETAYLRGNKNARVMVLEFSDYQCPFCSRVQPTIDRLISAYKDKVIFGYRHSPLPFHQEADEAAIAAECARDQGRFEQMHAILFKHYRNITIPKLKDYAREAGTKDMAAFSQCLDSEKYRPRLENDQKAALEAGIRGTPGFVIGLYDKKNQVVRGEILSGAQPYSVFSAMIDKYINKK